MTPCREDASCCPEKALSAAVWLTLHSESTGSPDSEEPEEGSLGEVGGTLEHL